MTTMRVIVFQEHGFWYAQGLEHDICVRGKNLDELQRRYKVAVQLESQAEGGVERIAQAPQKFFDMWASKSGGFTPETDPSVPFEFGMAA